MRGEIAYSKKHENEEKVGEDKMAASQRRFTSPAVRTVVVGYALTSKIKSFLQPKFERLAKIKGILFVPIDQTRPLPDKGPFDIVLHKVSKYCSTYSTSINKNKVKRIMKCGSSCVGRLK